MPKFVIPLQGETYSDGSCSWECIGMDEPENFPDCTPEGKGYCSFFDEWLEPVKNQDSGYWPCEACKKTQEERWQLTQSQ